MRISIVTPSFEQGRFIEATLRSVLLQRVPQLEYLVMDGGSRDGTVEILQRYEGSLVWLSEPDRGQGQAVNKGIQRSRGEIIGWLNSDDIYYPGALGSVLAFFAAHPEIDALYGDCAVIDEEGQIQEYYPAEPWDTDRLLDTNFVAQPAMFFRRTVVDRCGLLDEDLHYCLDYDYWLRFREAGIGVAYLPELLAGARIHAQMKTLAHRVAAHVETNDMLKRRFGAAPARWILNHSCVRLGIDRASVTAWLPLAILALPAVLLWDLARWGSRPSLATLRDCGRGLAEKCRHALAARRTRRMLPRHPRTGARRAA